MAKRKFDMAKSFKRDLRKHYLALVGEAWAEISNCLLNDLPIPEKYQDHPLKGDKSGFRDCHVKPDLVLIYKIVDDVVELHYLDSHSEIFG
ncbi:type II toxin-antitoxin system YafQ family toxin [Histophilus somni]|uniref:Type II toxin-antitoxin system YafQ family toxin n=1 Tax=Histophilus somni TaxID=731 RepID=A0A9Q6Z266_HISSO|nr:type II toxin-antitoxin system YafQ family toxin [Histophilus somni]ACA31192.1 addiction module toxin, RelE/StbE family [Histophilus somni 2336]ARU64803.1 addiction module toxin RelE [Histophilus somni]ARU66668.1 addiction module toxin RelE [Histophilus somni]ARU68542.1 addiction module toxin RelE [Histophilus somni]ARU70421.1 addiction module toxin RelE [Histophilus somni]